MIKQSTFNEQLGSALWQNLPTAALLLSEDLTIQRANNSACELFGCSEKRMQKQLLDNLFHYHSIDIEKLKKHSIAEGTDCLQHRAEVVFQDSRHAVLSVKVRYFVEDSHTWLLMELKPLDEELKHHQVSNQMHQHMAARALIRGLAHEIKNPLGGIRGAAQLLQYDMEQTERQECAGLIIEQADRLTHLVDRLLGPNQLPKKGHSNIHKTIESVLQLCLLDNDKQLNLIRDYDPSIPDVYIDEGQIHQVILNLVKNAWQALSSGQTIKVKTRIRYQHRLHDKLFKNALMVQISDNGPGIDESIKETLFYPMVTNKSGGSGLGLSIAQTLVDQHQGLIEFDSWPGHTEFNIYLPFNEESDQERSL